MRRNNFQQPRPPHNFQHRQQRPSYHHSSPQGMLLPRECQPPPMYGPRGSTVHPKFMPNYQNKQGTNDQHGGGHFFCETCDRSFQTMDILQEHKSEHQKCGIEGCKFIGHPLVVTKHIQMQHSSGLFEKIKNINTPEEIDKWRAERRKKYPTKENVELRQKVQEEKMKRGERLENPKNRFGNNRDRRPMDRSMDRGRGRGRGRGRVMHNGGERNTNHIKRTENVPEEQVVVVVKEIETETDSKEEEFNENLPMFKGTSMLDGFKPKKETKNALTNLLGNYGSCSESDEETQIEKVVSANIPEILEIPEDNIIEEKPIPEEVLLFEDNEDNVPEEVPILRSIDGPPEEPKASTDEIKDRRKRTRKRSYCKDNPGTSHSPPKKIKPIIDYSKLRHRRQNTLLEKLLQPDIRHERNVILQCVRFVVQNEFFEIGKEKEKTPSKE